MLYLHGKSVKYEINLKVITNIFSEVLDKMKKKMMLEFLHL